MRITGVAYQRRFAVDVPSEVADEVRERLPFGWAETAGTAQPERTWSLETTPAPTRAAALDRLLGDLELWVAEHAVDLVFVHAGAVAVGGRAIVVPGRTMAGKSTLVAALVRAGATYFSDEYTVLDADGLVRPYARRLALRHPDGTPAGRVTAEAIGGHTGTQPVPIGLVAHLRFDPAAGWAVEPLTRGRAALALLDNTVPARTRPVEVMDHLQAATEGIHGLTGTRGEADDAAARLLDLLGRPGRHGPLSRPGPLSHPGG